MKIENVGPIERLELDAKPGTLTVLRGRNGAGKSRALDAATALVRGSGSLSARDRSTSGSVEGWGATIKVSKSTRRSGTLEVTSLEGTLSVADLVDPGMKSDAAADGVRIKALIGLSGVEASADVFYSLLGGQVAFRSVVTQDVLETSDLVEMAAKTKRSIEAAARLSEDTAKSQTGQAEGMRTETEGLDLKGESDAAVLSDAHTHAVANKATIDTYAQTSQDTLEASRQAQEALNKSQAEYTGPTCGEAEATLINCETTAKDALERVTKARDALDAAAQVSYQANDFAGRAMVARDSAMSHRTTMACWQSTIDDAADIEVPTDEQLSQAADTVATTETAIQTGALIRQALDRAEQAKAFDAKADEHRKRAVQLREAAAGTDGVLSEAVAKTGSVLRVESGRLVLDTESRGVTFFSELSAGERWRIALDIAIPQLGAEGIIVIPQEAWEGLDPTNRQAVIDHIKLRMISGLTAEASDDEQVTAEVAE